MIGGQATAKVLAAGLVAVAALPGSVRAQDRGGARLSWSAPAGCPEEAAVQGSLEQRLGARSGVLVEARATVTRTAQGYRLALQTVANGHEGQRELEAVECGELADATEIIVALMVDPASVDPTKAQAIASAATETTASEAESEPEPEESDEAEDTPDEEPDDASPDESEEETDVEEPEVDAGPPLHLGFVARTALALDLGSLAVPAAGPALGLGLRLGRFELGLGGVWFPAQDVPSSRRDGRVAVLQLLSANASACYRVFGAERELAFSPCAVGELGRTWGRGIDIAQARRGGATWAAALLVLRIDWPIARPLGMYGELGAGLPLLRTAFRVQDLGTVHEAGPVLGRLSLGIALTP